MRITNALAALLTTLLISAAPIAAHAEETSPSVTSASVQGPDSTLESSWDQPMTPTEEKEVKKDLQGTLDEGEVHTFMPKPHGHGKHYPVVKCSDANRTFTDRNGRFEVRYNCRHNNVNWRFKVSRKLVAIAAGPMRESGMVWHAALRKLGHNSPHNVPVDYALHGTQGGVSNGDILHWSDRLTFPVAVGGRKGTAVLNIGGTFKISR